MSKAGAVLLGVGSIVIAGVALASALATRSQIRSLNVEREKDRDAMSKLTAKLDSLDRKLDAARTSRPPEDDADTSLPSREPRTIESQPKISGPSTAGGTAEPDAEFEELRKKLFEGEATDAETEKFWKIVREKPGMLDEMIKQLEKAAAENPRDKQAHRRLADAYLTKLMAVPDGMQKGIWSNKMIAEEKKILEIDPEDWGARWSIATNYSYWPEQFNKRPDAIKEFETLKQKQEGRVPEPRFAKVYFQLRQLYLKEGRVDDAKAVLDEGLRRFPEDPDLIKARDGAR